MTDFAPTGSIARDGEEKADQLDGAVRIVRGLDHRHRVVGVAEGRGAAGGQKNRQSLADQHRVALQHDRVADQVATERQEHLRNSRKCVSQVAMVNVRKAGHLRDDHRSHDARAPVHASGPGRETTAPHRSARAALQPDSIADRIATELRMALQITAVK